APKISWPAGCAQRRRPANAARQPGSAIPATVESTGELVAICDHISQINLGDSLMMHREIRFGGAEVLVEAREAAEVSGKCPAEQCRVPISFYRFLPGASGSPRSSQFFRAIQ